MKTKSFPTLNIPKVSQSGHHSLVVPQDAHEALHQDFTVRYQWTDDGPMVYSTVDAPLGYHDNLESETPYYPLSWLIMDYIDVCDPWAAVKGAETLGWEDIQIDMEDLPDIPE